MVREAAEGGYVDMEKADRWVEKLKSGVAKPSEDWPKFYVGLAKDGEQSKGRLVTRYETSNAGKLNHYVDRLQ